MDITPACQALLKTCVCVCVCGGLIVCKGTDGPLRYVPPKRQERDGDFDTTRAVPADHVTLLPLLVTAMVQEPLMRTTDHNGCLRQAKHVRSFHGRPDTSTL
jgi:hypothetical protein